jgi:hypothetical protein
MALPKSMTPHQVKITRVTTDTDVETVGVMVPERDPLSWTVCASIQPMGAKAQDDVFNKFVERAYQMKTNPPCKGCEAQGNALDEVNTIVEWGDEGMTFRVTSPRVKHRRTSLAHDVTLLEVVVPVEDK